MPPDSGAPDPATCPVGLADGCCPVGVMYGGMDPDCPSLACTTLHHGDPIPLDDLSQNTGTSGVGMAWTGRELALAWVTLTGDRMNTIMFETRDATGALLGQQATIGAAANGLSVSLDGVELGFHPETHDYLLVGDDAMTRHGLRLAADGSVTSDPSLLGATCNGITERHRIYPSPGRFTVAQAHNGCSGGDPKYPRVDLVGFDGKVISTAPNPGNGYDTGMAYDAVNDRVMFTYYNSGFLATRSFTPPATWSAEKPLLMTDMDESEAAFDGTNLGIVYGRYYFDGVGVATDPKFIIMPPSQSLVGSTDISPGTMELQIPPRLLWTGDGWLAIVTVYPSNGLGLPDSFKDFTSWVYSLAPDGTLRESFQLGGAGVFAVNATVADGKIAIAWLSTTDGFSTQHFLAWLDCPIH
jgi:hypothetical protein